MIEFIHIDNVENIVTLNSGPQLRLKPTIFEILTYNLRASFIKPLGGDGLQGRMHTLNFRYSNTWTQH